MHMEQLDHIMNLPGWEASGCAYGAGGCRLELVLCSDIWWTRLKGALNHGWASSIPSELHSTNDLFNGQLWFSPPSGSRSVWAGAAGETEALTS